MTHMLETPKCRYDLIAFDVDGTLVTGPDQFTVWEVLNKHFTGTPDHNKERYAAYLAGKLSYADWVALDVTGWRDAGANRNDIIEALAPLKLIDGVRETMQQLKATGAKLVVISGTLDLMLATLYPDHPFDEVYCNHLGFTDAGLIAHWNATPFDMQGKAEALRAVALRFEIPMSRCAFVGDSSNDVWIAQLAGYSIAINPRSEKLIEAVDTVLHGDDFRVVLPHLLAGAD